MGFNVINGRSHAGNKLAMQEFMILPTGASSFTEAMKMGSETYHHLKALIKEQYGLDATAVGDEEDSHQTSRTMRTPSSFAWELSRRPGTLARSSWAWTW